MFPEHRELISRLKGKHSRFDVLFEKHNRLDHEIKQLENSAAGYFSRKIVQLKLDKLEIKREIQQILEEEADRA
ncbi:TPA: DUF465 domain-containing protein [Escherichia coli]|nr:DUF465 domain-containing protein [Escherichia coli]